MDATASDADNRLMMENYVKRIHLAVAIAVIQTKPADVSARDYAISLANRYLNAAESWKVKCKEFETQVLRLEQQLSLNIMQTRLGPASVCLSYNDEHSERVDVVDLKHCGIEAYLQQTVEFVRSVLLFGSINATDLPYLRGHNFHHTVVRSLANAFEYLRSAEGLVLPDKIINNTVKAILQLFQLERNVIKDDIIHCSMAFVNYLLMDIFLYTDIDKAFLNRRRSILIQKVAEHRFLTVPVITRLIKEISVLGAAYKSADIRDQVKFHQHILSYENVYYVLQAFECILQFCQGNKGVIGSIRLAPNATAEWGNVIEEAIIGMGEKFPTFSLYVWHIQALLQSL